MTAASAGVDICNLALDYLGTGPVASITTPATTLEVLCSRWYDDTRRELLRKHVWNFAKARISISRNPTAPSFGYSDSYSKPIDFLRLLFIGDDSVGYYTKAYEIEGDQIILNNSGATSLNIGYIKDETAVGKFDSLFIITLALRLALNISFKLTLKNTVVSRVRELEQEASQKAMAIDGQERPPKVILRSKYLDARRSISTSSHASKFVTFNN